MKEVQVGLIGLGTVGGGVYQILTKKSRLLEERTGVRITLKKIADKDPKKGKGLKVPAALLTKDADEVINDPEISIIVELIGGTGVAGDLTLKAIKAGKHVITANKALLATRGAEIFRAAAAKKRLIGFEASVAGGIPILKAIREGFIGNEIKEIYGIINGTSNYILSEMSEGGRPFSEVLKVAQDKGYAEHDPLLDVGGGDAAQKLSILISLCYGVEPKGDGIFVEGIEKVTPLDIDFAKRFGYVIKMVAIAKEHPDGIEARVHPTLIPIGHPLADVGGVFNAVYLKGDAVGETMFFGQGAGRMPTASAVVSDIAMIARADAEGCGLLPQPVLRPVTFQPVEKLSSEYYLRFSVVDRPGVLAQIAQQLGKNDVSISTVYQNERDVGSKVAIVIMTHEAREKNIQKAIGAIDNLESVLDKTVLLRVQRL